MSLQRFHFWFSPGRDRADNKTQLPTEQTYSSGTQLQVDTAIHMHTFKILESFIDN